MKEVRYKTNAKIKQRNNFWYCKDVRAITVFFVAITALSLFILCLLYLEGEKKRERKSNGDKNKMHGVPIHPHFAIAI